MTRDAESAFVVDAFCGSGRGIFDAAVHAAHVPTFAPSSIVGASHLEVSDGFLLGVRKQPELECAPGCTRAVESNGVGPCALRDVDRSKTLDADLQSLRQRCRGHDYNGKRWRETDLPMLGWRYREPYATNTAFITLVIEDGRTRKQFVTASRTPRPSVTRSAEPESDYDHVSERSGVLSGFYECVKDAESRGEAIARNDIEVSVERVTEILKRGNLANATRSPSGSSTTSHRDAFDEIMKRPRPL